MNCSLKKISFILVFIFSLNAFSQRIGEVWKAQVGLGVNTPLPNGFVEDLESQLVNFPTFNLGLQRMFSRYYGGRFAYSFSRIARKKSDTEFKINYKRYNLEFIYDAYDFKYLRFLPERIKVVAHAGPGFSIAEPLSDLGSNKQSFFNLHGGLETHYYLTKLVSLYLDLSFNYTFQELNEDNLDFNGLGAFTGSTAYATVGISFSLSGCYKCY
jgi:hypothetical protein